MTMRELTVILWGLAFACAFCCLSTANAEGWFNPGMEGGGSALGEYDLNGDCLYYAKTADADTYLCRSGANEVTQTCGSVAIWVCNASGCDLAGELGSVTSLDATTETTIEDAIDTLGNVVMGEVTLGAAGRSKCTSSADDYLECTDSDGNGVRMDFSADEGMKLSTEAGNDLGLIVKGSLQILPSSGLKLGVFASYGKSYVTWVVDGWEVWQADKDTIADSGDGNPGIASATPTSSYMELTCNDGDGCTFTLQESGVWEGQQLQIVNVSTNAVTISDSAGVSELAGDCTMGQYDTLSLVYSGDAWIELSRSDN